MRQMNIHEEEVGVVWGMLACTRAHVCEGSVLRGDIRGLRC